MTDRRTGIPRREFLAGAAAASSLALGGGALRADEAADRERTERSPAEDASPRFGSKTSVTALENARPGADDWQLTRVRVDGSAIRCPWIEGYCTKQSVLPGESIGFCVSLNPAGEFRCEIFRLGYYGGKGARLMKTLGPVPGAPQPDPEVGPKRLRECKWQPTITLTIPDDWPSGVYLGRLTRESAEPVEVPWQSYVVFIVRSNRPADILVQCSDNTWQAYNRWPDMFSLYDTEDAAWALESGVDVSFDRPYGKYRQIYDNPQSLGSGEFLCWEFPLAYFLESHGYDVAYCSNSDQLTPDLGLRHKVFVSVGHDEYWDVRQYESVRRMIDEGVNAFFLCGNSVCFVSPFRDSHDGRPNRILTRAGCFGDMTEEERQAIPGLEVAGPDEALLIGARTVIPFNGGGDWIVTKPDHWLFEGTGMKQGDAIPGLVGWEHHGAPADIPGLEIIGAGTVVTGGGEPSDWTATIYPGPKGNFVFNAATIFWSQGLSSPPGHMLPWSHNTRPHGPDARVQRIMHNALARALKGNDSCGVE